MTKKEYDDVIGKFCIDQALVDITNGCAEGEGPWTEKGKKAAIACVELRRIFYELKESTYDRNDENEC